MKRSPRRRALLGWFAPLAWLATTCVLAAGCGGGGSGGAPACVPEDRETNPVCSTTETYFVSGDLGAPDTSLSVSGETERWLRVRFREDSNDELDVWGSLVLNGLGFDLYVYCNACGGTQIAGPADIVNLQATDHFAQTDSFNVLVEVRFREVGEGECSSWTLDVSGGVHTGIGGPPPPPVTCD